MPKTKHEKKCNKFKNEIQKYNIKILEFIKIAFFTASPPFASMDSILPRIHSVAVFNCILVFKNTDYSGKNFATNLTTMATNATLFVHQLLNYI